MPRCLPLFPDCFDASQRCVFDITHDMPPLLLTMPAAITAELPLTIDGYDFDIVDFSILCRVAAMPYVIDIIALRRCRLYYAASRADAALRCIASRLLFRCCRCRC